MTKKVYTPFIGWENVDNPYIPFIGHKYKIIPDPVNINVKVDVKIVEKSGKKHGKD